jgi:periplasmic protein TonB
MLSNSFPEWDKNRPIFFQLGMILALSFANIIINYESEIPDYSVYDMEEDPTGSVFQDVMLHSEHIILNPKPIKQNPNPLISKLVLVNDPIIAESKELVSEIQTSANTEMSDPINIIPTNNTTTIEHPKPIDNKIWAIAENMPYLAECDQTTAEEERNKCTQKTLLEFIRKNLKYPEIAKSSTIEGTVVLTFVIDREGNMKDITIARDIGGGCGQAAVKALSGLSKWKPGKQNNVAVHVKYNIPIKFKLD